MDNICDKLTIGLISIESNLTDYPSKSGSSILVTLSGCDKTCKSCQNDHLKDYNSGERLDDIQLFNRIVDFDLGVKKHQNVVFTGGDPFSKHNRLIVMLTLSKLLTRGYNVLVYTGESYKTVSESPTLAIIATAHIYKTSRLLFKCGQYVQDKKQKSGFVDGRFQLASTNQGFYEFVKNEQRGLIKLEQLSTNGVMDLL